MTDHMIQGLRDALTRYDERPDINVIAQLVSTARAVADRQIDTAFPEEVERSAGIDLAIGQLCAVLGVDPADVSRNIEAKDEMSDVAAVVANVLTVRFGDRWRMDIARATNGEFSQDVREEVALRIFMQENDTLVVDGRVPDYEAPRSSWASLKEKHPDAAARVYLAADRILEAAVPLPYPDDPRELIALCVFMHDHDVLSEAEPDFKGARSVWEHYQTLPQTSHGIEHRTAADRIATALENARRQA